jgi:hypothetical protein
MAVIVTGLRGSNETVLDDFIPELENPVFQMVFFLIELLK